MAGQSTGWMLKIYTFFMVFLFKLSAYGNHLGLFILVIPIIFFTLIMSSMVSNRHREHDSLVLLCSYTYAHGFLVAVLIIPCLFIAWSLIRQSCFFIWITLFLQLPLHSSEVWIFHEWFEGLHYFLDIEVYKNIGDLFLSQSKYATDLLSHASMGNAKPIYIITTSICYLSLFEWLSI